MTSQPSHFFCSAEIGKIVLEGAVEILGAGISSSILAEDSFTELRDAGKSRSVIPVSVLDRFQEALVDRLGLAGGQGTALRIGRAAFRYGLKHFGKATGLSSLEYRLLPTPYRVRTGLERMAGVINEVDGRLVQVEVEPVSWIWRQAVGQTSGEVGHTPDRCYLTLGALQGFLAWASGGRYFPMTVENQPAEGVSYQIIRIDQKPLD